MKGHTMNLCARFTTNMGLWLTMTAYFLVNVGLLAGRLNYLLPCDRIDNWFVVANCAGRFT